MNSKEKTKYRTSKKWKDFRKKLIKKNDHHCQICNIKKVGKMTRYLQVHHLNPENYGHEKDSDVVLICSFCHKLIENLLRRTKNVVDITEYCTNLKHVFNSSNPTKKRASHE